MSQSTPSTHPSRPCTLPPQYQKYRSCPECPRRPKQTNGVSCRNNVDTSHVPTVPCPKATGQCPKYHNPSIKQALIPTTKDHTILLSQYPNQASAIPNKQNNVPMSRSKQTSFPPNRTSKNVVSPMSQCPEATVRTYTMSSPNTQNFFQMSQCPRLLSCSHCKPAQSIV